MVSTVARIADYVVATRGTRAAEPARQAAFRCLLDLLGCAAAAVANPASVAVRRVALETLAAGSVPIWFAGLSSSAKGAAWANSTAASALDLDDGHRLARGHPGAAVIPVALAVAHETSATLEDILTAIVIGYEVGVTIGAARLSYGNTGTWASYAVVATAAALRGTPREVLAHALAIAGESAPNQLFSSAPAQTPAPEGSDVKEGIPWSVVTGLAALELADAGWTGPRNILDSALFYRFPEGLVLGSAQHICNVYFKLYACCRHVHPPVDALLSLMHRHSISASSIDSIKVDVYGAALRISNTPDPVHLVDVQYSIPYCLGLAATVGPRVLLPLNAKVLTYEEARALAHRVSLSLDTSLDARFPAQTLARVTVICGAQQFVSEVTAPRGEASNPLSWEELEAKFRAATGSVATEAQQIRVLGALDAARAGRVVDLAAGLPPDLSACLTERLATQP